MTSPAPLMPRLMEQSVQVGDCLEFHGARMPNGYRTISWNNRTWLAHRAIWTHERGSIEGDLTVDHLCRNRSCINLDHLELVSRAENARRGGWVEARVAKQLANSYCRRGHLFDGMQRGGRKCILCSRVGHYTRKVKQGWPLDRVPAECLAYVQQNLTGLEAS